MCDGSGMNSTPAITAATMRDRRVHPPADHFAQPPRDLEKLVEIHERLHHQAVHRAQRDQLPDHLQTVRLKHLVKEIQNR